MQIGGDGSSLLVRLMDAASMRARVLASNLANQNTPGFKRREVQFEDLLLRALERPGGRFERVRPEVVVDRDAEARADGNTVSAELEVTELRENRLAYELYASILQGQMSLVRSAIHGER